MECNRSSLLLVSLILLSLFADAQTVSVNEDFEGGPSLSTWFGDACGMNTGLANPFIDPGNPSATVLEYHDTGGQYANVRFEVSPNFDLSSGSLFSLRIYVPSSGLTGSSPNQVSLKLQDGTLGSPWVTQSEIIKPILLDQWQEVTFNFASDPWINLDPGSAPPTTRSDFNRVVIQVNGENNFDHVLAYLDDIEFDGSSTPPGPSTDPVYDNLVWADEFDVDGPIDASKWHHQTLLPLPDSWYNGEIQHYTDRIDNSYVDNGTLKIVAKTETFTDQGVTKQHTSARLNSKFAFTYGKVEVRARLPFGPGTWPAIWMLGKNINEDGAYWDNLGYGTTGWPACGEIDIMEHWGINQGHVSSATHTPSSFGATVNVGGQYIPTVSSDFHLYTMEWYPDRLVFAVDGVVHFTYAPPVLDASTWPFTADQYLLFNVAVLPDIYSASFTSSALEVDYVRVYQESPCPVPTGVQTNILSSTEATLSWDSVPGAIGYQVTGGPVGSPAKQFKTSGTSRTISILNPSTDYEWQVRAYCDPEFSSYSSLQSFTTPAVRNGIQLSISPNPTKGTVMVRAGNTEELLLQVTDLNGRSVYSQLLNGVQEVSLEKLPDGIYIVKLIGTAQTAQELLVVH